MNIKTQVSEIPIVQANFSTIFLVYNAEEDKFAFERCEVSKADDFSVKGLNIEFNKAASNGNSIKLELMKTYEMLVFRSNSEVSANEKSQEASLSPLAVQGSSPQDYKWTKVKDIKIGDRVLKYKNYMGQSIVESFPVINIEPSETTKMFYKIKAKGALIADNFIIQLT